MYPAASLSATSQAASTASCETKRAADTAAVTESHNRYLPSARSSFIEAETSDAMRSIPLRTKALLRTVEEPRPPERSVATERREESAAKPGEDRAWRPLWTRRSSGVEQVEELFGDARWAGAARVDEELDEDSLHEGDEERGHCGTVDPLG